MIHWDKIVKDTLLLAFQNTLASYSQHVSQLLRTSDRRTAHSTAVWRAVLQPRTVSKAGLFHMSTWFPRSRGWYLYHGPSEAPLIHIQNTFHWNRKITPGCLEHRISLESSKAWPSQSANDSRLARRGSITLLAQSEWNSNMSFSLPVGCDHCTSIFSCNIQNI